ncbi:signal peptidase I [Anaerorhabdus furcosa]|uniref:Signal peptidase I n=1 Tax=Anaerorhabdus furcosa TaxID=118967 RepID=A0A1T4KE36_9FIRM|nr:signal peptidase I [Anaerorhabdus furcosa]SJZ40669.1 signal peptidase I [Anaerorhabdus furcosa]
MSKSIKRISHILFNILLAVLFMYSFFSFLYPEQTYKIIGFKIFSILTDSMDPTIPPGSMVLIKKIDDPSRLPINTIITFNADRLGEKIVLTHRLAKIETEEDGKIRYYTQADGYYGLDSYETYADDLIGQYVLHIPYLGKIGLFLQSFFALVMMFIIFIIYQIYNYLMKKADREAILKFEISNQSFETKNLDRKEYENITIVSGTLVNITDYHFDYIKIQLALVNKKQIVTIKEYFISQMNPHEEVNWTLWFDTIDFDSVKVKITTKQNKDS